MSTKTIGKFLNRGYEIRGSVQGDEMLGSTLHYQIFLGGMVDADDAVADGAGGELDSEVAEAAACA
jgi:hypothetical protein